MWKKKLKIAVFIISAAITFNCKGSSSERFQTDKPRIPLKEYSRNDPGEWVGLEDQHYPRVTIDNSAMENIIIRVNFPIKHEPDHYIEKIGLMDKDGNDIIVKRFNPAADYWEARFNIPFIPKGAKAFARCSLHDLWVTPLSDAHNAR
ncbi:MAG: desulfoferrodoxin family protein [Spirochaetia bacterium]|nr:desulfoferrodoxin family protein [Spirochaetia bacterium]